MKRILFSILLFVLIGILQISCQSSSSGSRNTSKTTGWGYNTPSGFKVKTNYKEQETGPGLVFIEGGSFTKGRIQDDVMHDWNNSPSQQHVQSFYMDEYEIRNVDYMEYLDWLKKTFPPSEPLYENIYKGALPDTLVWRNRLGFNEMMTNNYLRHPAYQNYPVVGVNWIQAVQYSKWRTDRVNEYIMSRDGYVKKGAYKDNVSPESIFSTDTYLAAPTATYGGNEEVLMGKRIANAMKKGNDSILTDIYAQRSDGVLLPKYRLPTETEWEYAALGLVGVRKYNMYRGRKKYPWSGKYTRSGNKRHRGDQMANFKLADGDYGGIAEWSGDGADITAPVGTYEPNDFGLYDMAGNVAEWVDDVYRPIIDDEYNDFNYYRGNVYTKNKLNRDGTVQLVAIDSMQVDTLANGRIITRSLPGEIVTTELGEEDAYLRLNFDKGDNRNFRDGDKQSSRYYEDFQEFGKGAHKMYNSPKYSLETDEDGNTVRKYSTDGKITSINDTERIYKGGSWKDREYWLDPAQRRHFPQYFATEYIGFRNAMSRVGEKSKLKRKTPVHRGGAIR